MVFSDVVVEGADQEDPGQEHQASPHDGDQGDRDEVLKETGPRLDYEVREI